MMEFTGLIGNETFFHDKELVVKFNMETSLKYQISVPQVIRVPQQKSTLKTGQIS